MLLFSHLLSNQVQSALLFCSVSADFSPIFFRGAFSTSLTDPLSDLIFSYTSAHAEIKKKIKKFRNRKCVLAHTLLVHASFLVSKKNEKKKGEMRG